MQLTRRQMLRAAGTSLALPFMESLLPRTAWAAAQGVKPPLRMGIFTVTGGTVLESWKLPQPGPLDKLPSILRPLEFAKDDMLIVSGLSASGRGENVNGHEHCAFLHLTASEGVKKENGRIMAGGLSVDQMAAEAIGGQSILPSLEIGLTGGETREYGFLAPDVNVPFEANPRLVFDRMFRGRKPVTPNWQRRSQQPTENADQHAKTDSDDASVLDLVRSQAADLQRKLGKADGRKLGEYLESVRSVEKRIALLEARYRQELLDLAAPGPSQLVIPKNLPKEGVPIWEITRPVEQDPEKHGEYIRIMAELMVLAFQTDTTRVVTMAAGSDESMFHGVVTVGFERHCHTLEHQGNSNPVENADPIAREACRQIHAWYTGLFAEMIARMKGIDEGGSSLLDNSMILYTSYMADGGHGRDDYPAVLLGKAGGTLKTGRQISFEKKAPTANLYLEMLDRMGVKLDRFGESHTSQWAGDLNGRLPGLV